jgi:hypothetical protein
MSVKLHAIASEAGKKGRNFKINEKYPQKCNERYDELDLNRIQISPLI